MTKRYERWGRAGALLGDQDAGMDRCSIDNILKGIVLLARPGDVVRKIDQIVGCALDLNEARTRLGYVAVHICGDPYLLDHHDTIIAGIRATP